MAGFFLVCAGPDEDRADEVIRLREAFAELGFAPPEIIKEEGYLLRPIPSSTADRSL
jgi:hypothetical protein